MNAEKQQRHEELVAEVRHIAKEIRPLTDSVDSLYILLQHVWQNRDELTNLLYAGRPEDSDIVRCLRCHESPTLLGAVQDGWSDLREEEGKLWGTCQRCISAIERESVLPAEKLYCTTCDATVMGIVAGLRKGWSCIMDNEGFERGNYAGRCPSCTKTEEALEDMETTQYCCQFPHLEWLGEHDAPSVICKCCGFVVAECGQLMDYGSEMRDEPEEVPPKVDEQRRLF